jgi:hypothetical protein
VTKAEFNAAEKLRIAAGWHGKCRTCVHWRGEMISMKQGKCAAPVGPLRHQVTQTSDRCAEWVTFDAAITAQALCHLTDA